MTHLFSTFLRRGKRQRGELQTTGDSIGPVGRIALRVAVPFTVAATVWAVTISLLATMPGFLTAQYDFLLDLLFAIITAMLLYRVVSSELKERTAAQQAAIAETWRAANDALEARVVERTEELQKANGLLQAEISRTNASRTGIEPGRGVVLPRGFDP